MQKYTNIMQKCVFLYNLEYQFFILTNIIKCSIIYLLQRRRDTFKWGIPCLSVFFYKNRKWENDGKFDDLFKE